ncbi:MAG: hypothetical protein DWP95_11010 [Proteobacteria bacterium]|nr:MAG: hypothetical protein DWP95_11010 [Pseudomonadota bacterium]
MKPIFCAVILLIATTLMAQQNSTTNNEQPNDGIKQFADTMGLLMREPSEAERDSMELYGAWMQAFIGYLLNHEQPYAQAIALQQTNAILRSQSSRDDSDSLQAFYQSHGNHINNLLKNEVLNIETLQILQALCFQQELDNVCDRKTLLDKQMQLYPYDLSVYLRPLQLAIEADNQELTTKLMKVMSGAQHFSMVDYLLPEFNTLVKNYFNENPIPEAALLREKNNYLLTQDLTEQQKSMLENQFNDYMPYNILISMQLALPIPAFKPLKDLCQTEKTYSADCLYIAKTLLHKSNSKLSKAMGHIINLAVYELNNQQDMLAASHANQLRLKKYTECISQSIEQNQQFEDMFDKDFSEHWLTAEDELIRLNKIATYLYEKRQAEGAQNNPNPENC